MPPPPPTLSALLVMPAGAARRGAKAALESAGLTVRAAPEPYAATLAFAEHRADLVVLDLATFRRKDAAFLRAVRRLSPGTRILLLLPEGQRRAALAALKQGADAYVLDPFHAEELAAVARGLLRERQSAEAADPEALRRLAAEVAHAINNPLQVLSLAQEAAPPGRGAPAQGALSDPGWREPVGRIRDVVALLAAFGRLGEVQRLPLSLGEAARGALETALAAGQVRLVGSPPADGPTLLADPAQLKQALGACLAFVASRAPRLPLELSARLVEPQREGGAVRLQLLARGLLLSAEEQAAALHTLLTSHEQTRRPLPGLALPASVARLHGGALRLKAARAGLVLTLRLPG